MKEIVKLAIIRKNKNTPCPFGLKIPFACSNAGEITTKMAPVDILGDEAEEDEIKSLVAANRKLLMLEADGHRCPYADKIFKDQKAVECNFDSNAPGVSQQGLEPSKFYSKVYNNIGYDGLYSFPIGWYGDNNISRNLYYGAYSLQGSAKTIMKKRASVNNDVKDAIEHAIMMEDPQFTGSVCYKTIDSGYMSLSKILNWDDYNNWGEFDSGELLELSEDEFEHTLNNFRPGYYDLVKQWMTNPEKPMFPPIILVDTLNVGKMIGDGRGRVSVAVGLNLKTLPFIIIKETEGEGDCFELKHGRIK